MKKIFLLSKQDVKLAAYEILSLEDGSHELIDNLLAIDTKFNDYSRLAYTKAVYDLLFIADEKNLRKSIDSFDWQKIYKKDFCVRRFDVSFSSKELGSMIWLKLKKPKVNLSNPATEMHFIKAKGKVFCGLLKYLQKEDFESRKAHNRPELHPSSMHPKLSRAFINLTGIPSGKILCDPFCGSGGILIEAGLIGCKTIGYDIDKEMIERAKANLLHYKVGNFNLEQKNALLIDKKIDYVVSDLPYRRNTKATELNKLYLGFFKVLEKELGKCAVLGFPDFIDYKKLISKTKLKIAAEFSYYLHKSLTKKIVVIKRR
jgi:tRNA (guanine10-N2)-dimethyltransferase